MYLKSYRQHTRRVPNPLQPGRWSSEARLVPAGGSVINHQEQTYYADENGWFNVPHELGEFLRRGAYPGGERFLQPFEAVEQSRVGVLEDVAAGPVERTTEPVAPKVAPVKRAVAKRRAN